MKKQRLSKWLNLAEPKTIDGKITVEIFIEGIIGWSWWDSDETVISTKEEMRKELVSISELNADKIIVNISSYGGDVDHALAMLDLLKLNKAEIETNVYGMTASAATIISQAASLGLRKISDNALFLPHCGSSCECGNKFRFKQCYDDLVLVDQRIANVYAKASGKTSDEMLAIMELNNGEGKWFAPQDVLNMGFVDIVYEPVKAVALNLPRDKTFFKNMGLPEVPSELLERIKNKTVAVPIVPVVQNEVVEPNLKPIMAKKVTTLKQALGVLNNLKTKKIENLTPEETSDVDEAIKAADALSKMLTQLKEGTAPDDAPMNKFFKNISAKLSDRKAGKVVNLTPEEDTQLSAAITHIEQGVTMAAELTSSVDTTTTNKGTPATPVIPVNETAEQKELRELKASNALLTSQLAQANAQEIKTDKADDPTANGNGSTKTANQIANDKNAEAFRNRAR